MTLGGRVSEEIFFPVITTGAQDDLQKITKMAFEACANYGMNPDIGPISYGNRDQQGEGFQKPFSEATAQSLDRAVHNMVKDAHRRTTELLTKHKEDVIKVATLLLDKEVITREDMRNCESQCFVSSARRPACLTRGQPCSAWTTTVRYG